MNRYYIDYGTGEGNEAVAGSLNTAKAIADNGAAFTQQDIVIYDANGVEIARRRWWNVDYDPDATEETQAEVIQFGTYGFFGAWHES